MKKKATKKRNPNDATHRNIRALKKRVERLELGAKYHDHMIEKLYGLLESPQKRRAK